MPRSPSPESVVTSSVGAAKRGLAGSAWVLVMYVEKGHVFVGRKKLGGYQRSHIFPPARDAKTRGEKRNATGRGNDPTNLSPFTMDPDIFPRSMELE